jgi:uncharacterized protein (DUF1800 family)
LNLDRFEAGRDGPFGAREVAHLFRRGGFGLAWDEARDLAAQGLDAALERLFAEDEGEECRALLRSVPVALELDDLPPIQALWFARMRGTKAPAREKLALFWHGHFATSFDKVRRGAFMWHQYELFRGRGMGPFEELLLEVSRDPAMLFWLDSNANEKQHPNENYSRELLELFTLGLGHYDEQAVKEAARAFSGWHTKDERFWFNARVHDDGEKELFGARGPFDGGDVLRLCVQQRACPHRIAAKLLAFYVLPDPAADEIDELAAALRGSDFVLEPVLRRLFASRFFYSERARGTVIKSPCDFCVGALRATRARASPLAAARACADMGQSLFAPPNVKGWDGHRGWITSRSMLVRSRFAESLSFGGGGLAAHLDPDFLVPREVRADPERLVGALADALLQAPITAETLDRLVEFARSRDAGTGEPRLRALSFLLLSSPDAQFA